MKKKKSVLLEECPSYTTVNFKGEVYKQQVKMSVFIDLKEIQQTEYLIQVSGLRSLELNTCG